MQLWTEKHKPKSMEKVIGQGKAIKETINWLNSWEKGKGLLFHGLPGCGKTLVAEMIAKEKGFILVELNASDKRTAEEIENFSNNLSIKPLFHSGKLVLIDEVDGISSRERGATTSLIKLIKNSCFPVILTANDPWIPKLKSLRTYCTLVRFGKVHSLSIEKRLKDICKEEDISYDENILKNLSKWSQGDLRSAINDLQTICSGRIEINEENLEILGYRERENSVFNSLISIFHSRNINASRKAFYESDKDSDEILWWIETNMGKEFSSAEMPKAYECLAKADLFRKRVSKQQNWRFKAFMTDMLSGISVFKKEKHGFTRYAPPDRFIRLGKSRQKRNHLNEICSLLGEHLHASKRVVKRDYIPYLKIIVKKKKDFASGFLEKEDIEFIKKL